MANKNSAKKALRQSAKRAVANKSERSRIKTFMKQATVAAQNSSTNSADVITNYEKIASRAARKGLISKKSVSRKVSKLTLRLKKLSVVAK